METHSLGALPSITGVFKSGGRLPQAQRERQIKREPQTIDVDEAGWNEGDIIPYVNFAKSIFPFGPGQG
jgi:hypothetical protein